jgi:hypothetical protein
MTKNPKTPKTTITDTGDQWVPITDTGAVHTVKLKGGGNNMFYNPARMRGPVRGRPTEHEWQDILRWLVAKVDEEGGLPQESRGQAKVEGWILDQFKDKWNLYPSETLVKEQVRAIYLFSKEKKGR